jgi:RimJ/RimL family protein N-acetyltransferase
LSDFPTLKTSRLLLRQFLPGDAPDVQRIAGRIEIARSTFVPHPYEDGVAEEWIESQERDFQKGAVFNFAVVLSSEDRLIGSIGLVVNPPNRRAQLGYWIDSGFWNRGYCTEAARAVLQYGFDDLDLHRIWAPHFRSNPASGRVLQKLGFTHEGRQRDHYLRFDRYEDAELYGLLKSDYEKGQLA